MFFFVATSHSRSLVHPPALTARPCQPLLPLKCYFKFKPIPTTIFSQHKNVHQDHNDIDSKVIKTSLHAKKAVPTNHSKVWGVVVKWSTWSLTIHGANRPWLISDGGKKYHQLWLFCQFWLWYILQNGNRHWPTLTQICECYCMKNVFDCVQSNLRRFRVMHRFVPPIQ